MDPSLIFGKIAELAPEWNPFPILQQLDQMMNPAVGGNTMQPGGQFGWANPLAAPPIPQLPETQLPEGVQIGQPALPGGLPVPPGAKALAPLTPQQLAALAAMGQRGQQPQGQPRAPGVAPQRGAQSVQMQQLPVGAATPRMGLAQILGMGR